MPLASCELPRGVMETQLFVHRLLDLLSAPDADPSSEVQTTSAVFAQPLALCTPGPRPGLLGITVIQLNGDNNHLAGCSTCLERAGQCVHLGQVCASFELIKKLSLSTIQPAVN